MAVDPGLIVSAGAQIFGGLFGKKKSGNKVSRRTQNEMLELFDIVDAYDPASEYELSAEQTFKDTQRLAEQALTNVFSKFSVNSGVAGSSALTDTARSGVLRGVTTDIFASMQRQIAEHRAGATRDKINARVTALSLSKAGKGETLQNNNAFNGDAFVSTIGELAKQAFK